MKWIDVKERMPVSGKEVLSWSPQIGFCLDFYNEKMLAFSSELRDEIQVVDYWMELPAPPKENPKMSSA